MGLEGGAGRIDALANGYGVLPGHRFCDLVIRGGRIIANDGVIWDGALAVMGDRIVAIGDRGTIDSAWAGTRVIEAAGAVVMPGFVNVHNHTPLTIVRGIAEDLGFAPAYTPRIPQGYSLSQSQTHALSRLGVWELLRQGCTTIADHYRFPEALARAAVEIGPRAFIGGRIHDADMPSIAQGTWQHDQRIGDETLDETVSFIEAWQGRHSRVAPLVCPHAPDTCTADLLSRIAGVASHFDLPVHTHLAQSQAEVDRVVERGDVGPVSLLAKAGLLTERLVAAHCIHLDSAGIADLGAAGATVAHAPLGNISHGSIAPVVALGAAGAKIALCTDTKSGDMFETTRAALACARVRGAGTALRGQDVFRWATAGGATALGLAGETGSLAVGRKADIVVLDPDAANLQPMIDPLGIVVHNGNGCNVRQVVVDGVVAVEDGRPTLCDLDSILNEGKQAAEHLWRAAGFDLPPRNISP